MKWLSNLFRRRSEEREIPSGVREIEIDVGRVCGNNPIQPAKEGTKTYKIEGVKPVDGEWVDVDGEKYFVSSVQLKRPYPNLRKRMYQGSVKRPR